MSHAPGRQSLVLAATEKPQPQVCTLCALIAVKNGGQICGAPCMRFEW